MFLVSAEMFEIFRESLGKGEKVKFSFIWIISLILFEELPITLLHKQDDRGGKISCVDVII